MAAVPLAQFLPPQLNQTRSHYLETWEERWNKRVDQDVTILGEGLGKVVAVAQVSPEPTRSSYTYCHTHGSCLNPQRSLQPSLAATSTSHLALQVQTQTLIQSAESLLALTHQLKLLVMLSESETPRAAKDKEEKELAGQVEHAKQEIGDALKALAADV